MKFIYLIGLLLSTHSIQQGKAVENATKTTKTSIQNADGNAPEMQIREKKDASPQQYTRSSKLDLQLIVDSSESIGEKSFHKMRADPITHMSKCVQRVSTERMVDHTTLMYSASSQWNYNWNVLNAFRSSNKHTNYPRWASARGSRAFISISAFSGRYIMTALSFSSPYNPWWKPNNLDIWKEVPRSFSVLGTKDGNCFGKEKHVTWKKLLDVSNTHFTKANQNRRWHIPCDTQDAFECYLIKFQGNSGHRCNCESICKLKWYHSTVG